MRLGIEKVQRLYFEGNRPRMVFSRGGDEELRAVVELLKIHVGLDM